jgi:hypothetical protein
MLSNSDIWRYAHFLMKRHGSDAVHVAAMRVDAMLDRGDRVGCLVWNRVVNAIKEREREKPKHSENMD